MPHPILPYPVSFAQTPRSCYTCPMERNTIHHEIPPVYDANSRVLILGTMPSPKSRAAGFFYGHPQNRFWGALCAVLDEPLPRSVAEKRAMLLRRGIALWDVLASCEIAGAADSSIRNPVVNDFSPIFAEADIRAVFTTGKTAARLYKRLCGKESICLPSPSPANCALPMEALVEEYRAILSYLDPNAKRT